MLPKFWGTEELPPVSPATADAIAQLVASRGKVTPLGVQLSQPDALRVVSMMLSNAPAVYVERAKFTTDDSVVMALDMEKLFPAAGTVDSWAQSLPADVVADVLSELGQDAPSANGGK